MINTQLRLRVLFDFVIANKDRYFAVNLLKYLPSRSSTFLPTIGHR